MLVLHFSATSLAGAPIRLVSALNKYSALWQGKARLITYSSVLTADQRPIFDLDIDFQKSEYDDIIELVKQADILHFHHPIDIESQNNPFSINFKNGAKSTAKYVFHFHSSLQHYTTHFPNNAKVLHARDRHYFNKNEAFISISQYHLRYFPNSFCCPNVVDIYDQNHTPLITENSTPIVAYAPSSENGAFSFRWDTKSYDVVRDLLDKLTKDGVIQTQTILRTIHAEAMALRRLSDILIDDLSTGSYHLTGLEGLSLGKPTLCYLDSTILSNSYATLGAPPPPFINIFFEGAEKALRSLCHDKDLRSELGSASRSWMEQYYDPKIITKKVIEVYEALAQETHRPPALRYADTHPRVFDFLNIQIPDFMYKTRKDIFEKLHAPKIVEGKNKSGHMIYNKKRNVRLVNLLTCLIPVRAVRHRLRKSMLHSLNKRKGNT